ncbi:30S ribosomal protein S24e [Salarchaeum sp. III]|uniref:30S ribosomal protein S24e n=1 Tax=Salarchaeum sp. III TaxID=3107927 RepID=UPI002ED9063D
MEIDILEQDDNPLLHRTEVSFEITHEDVSPSRLSVRDSLAAQLDKNSDEVVVHSLDTKFGMRKTVGYAKVYDSAESAIDVEQEYMLDRNKISAESEEGANAAEAEGEE